MRIAAFHLPRRLADGRIVQIPTVSLTIGDLPWHAIWGAELSLGVPGTVWDVFDGSRWPCWTWHLCALTYRDWETFGWWAFSPLRPMGRNRVMIGWGPRRRIIYLP